MQIIFNNFIVKTIIGVYAHEKLAKQDIPICLKIDFNADKAANSDNLEDTIDYDKIANILNDIADQNKFNLLEKMARLIRDNLVAAFPIIDKLEIELFKSGVVEQAENISVKEFYDKNFVLTNNLNLIKKA
jgi:FolB domain-containing protein